MASIRHEIHDAHDIEPCACVSSASDAIKVSLANEELAAVEGWRAANLIDSVPDAVRELVRLGLLSEIARVHQLVADIRASVNDRGAGLKEN